MSPNWTEEEVLFGPRGLLVKGGGYPSPLVLDSEGDVYFAGRFSGTVDFDPGSSMYNLSTYLPGSEDGFVCKLTNDGNLVWARQMGFNTPRVPPEWWGEACSVTVDSHGDVYVLGTFCGMADFDPGPGVAILTALGGLDTFILKLNSAGNFVWVKHLGGNKLVSAINMTSDVSGNVYCAGHFSGTVDFDPGPATATVTATEANNDDAHTVDQYILKLDSSGDFVWVRQLKGVSGGDDVWSSGPKDNIISVDSAGNVYTTGFVSASGADLNPGPGTVYVSPYSRHTAMFVLKLDSSGSFVWANTIGDTRDDDCWIWQGNIAIDLSANVYVTNSFIGHLLVDTGSGVTELISPFEGQYNSIVLKFDPVGNAIWAKQLVGVDSRGSNGMGGIAVDAFNNVCTGGGFRGTVDFDPGPGAMNMTESGVAPTDFNGDIYLLKLSGLSPKVDSVTFEELNGSVATFTVEFDQCVEGVDLSDFGLETSGLVAGAAVLSVTGSCATYTITVDIGSGDGRIRLLVLDDDTIMATLGSGPLGGAGAGNGSFLSGDILDTATGEIVLPMPVWLLSAAVMLTALGTILRRTRHARKSG
jgi:hypothetical protein